MKQEKCMTLFRFDRSRIGRALLERGGFAGWIVNRIQSGAPGRNRNRARLALVERIALAPRQSLVLVEAEGRKILVATSPEGAPAFFPLDGMKKANHAASADASLQQTARSQSRVSW